MLHGFSIAVNSLVCANNDEQNKQNALVMTITIFIIFGLLMMLI